MRTDCRILNNEPGSCRACRRCTDIWSASLEYSETPPYEISPEITKKKRHDDFSLARSEFGGTCRD